jgi:subtilisin-like proprotein convertase family protein
LSSTVTINQDINVEWAEVMFDATHPSRGDLKVTLTSPSGTESILAEPHYDPGTDYYKWVFTSNRNWGETSLGDWTLEVSDDVENEAPADGSPLPVQTWNSWKLNLYGTAKSNVTITADDASGNENGNTAQFIVTRSGGDLNKPLTVNYSVAGNAINGSDYSTLPGTITIPAGATSVTIPVIPKSDGEVEGNETVQINLIDAAGYNLDPVSTATATITDNTLVSEYGPFVYTNPANGHRYILSQGDTWLGAQAQAQALGGNLLAINDAAEQAWLNSVFNNQGAYWIGLTDSEIYGTTEGKYKWVNGDSVTYTNWDIGEPSNSVAPWKPEGEDFSEMYANGKWNDASSIDPSTVDSGRRSQYGIIEIDPATLAKPIVLIQSSDAKAGEEGNAGQLIVTRIGDTTNPLTVNYSVAGDAINGVDYQALNGTITIPAGASLVTIPIVPIGDYQSENAEKVVVNLTANSSYQVSAQGTGTVEISDRNFINQISNEVIGRDVTNLAYWQNRLSNGASLSDIRREIIQAAQDSQGNSQFTTQVQQIYQNALGRAATTTELANWRTYLENGGTLAQIRQSLGNSSASNAVYTNPITGNQYFLTASDTWLGAEEQAKAAGGNLVVINDATEQQWLNTTFGGGSRWIGLTDSPIYGATEGNYKWVNGQPVAYTNWWGTDNVLSTPEGEDFAEMGWGAEGKWNDMPSDQAWIRTGIVEIASPPTAQNLTMAQIYTEDTPLDLTNIVVTSPDGQATVTLTVPVEAGSLTTVSRGIRRGWGYTSVGTSGSVTSTYDAATGKWTASGYVADVNALLAGLQFIPAANYNSVFNITTEVATSVAAPLTGYLQMVGIPVNDAPTLSSVSMLTGAKDNTPFTITYDTLAAAANEADIDSSTIAFQIDSLLTGTLTKNGVAIVPGVTTVAPGESLVWTPAIAGENLAFTVRANDFQAVSSTSIPVKIDVIPTVTITASDANATEGADSGAFTITRTGKTDKPLTVNYSVANDSYRPAINGSDYNNLSGTITIPAGQSSVTIPLTPIDDNAAEWEEPVYMNLSADSGYLLGASTGAQVTIWDNETPEIYIGTYNPSYTFGWDGYTSESSNTTSLLVRRLGSLANDVTVNYTLTGTATNGLDYSTLPGSILLAAGQHDTYIPFTAINDTLVESDETAILTLLPGANNTVGGEVTNPTVGTSFMPTLGMTSMTIGDNDSKLTANIVATDAIGSEYGDRAEFTISLTDANGNPATATVPLTLNYSIWGADNGGDYTNLPGTITIPVGSSSAKLVVNPINDELVEGSEGVGVLLYANFGDNYAVGANEVATLNITDNDYAASYVEDTTLDLPDAIIADPDGNTSVTLTLSDLTAGKLTTGTSGAVTSSFNAATGKWTASGALADVNALLANLKFVPNANYNSDLSISIAITDNPLTTLPGTIKLTGIPVDDAPTIEQSWTYFGEDINSTENTATPNTDDPQRLTSKPNSDVARNNFLASLSNSAVESFESFANGSTLHTLTFGTETASLSGDEKVRSLTNGTYNGSFPITGNKFLNPYGDNPFTITFNSPQSAFGFSATDIGDFQGQLVVTLQHEDGSNEEITVPHTVSNKTISGSAIFFGVVDTKKPFTSVTFNSTQSTDGFGVDDIIVGQVKPDAVAPTTYPGTKTISQTYIENTSLNLTNLAVNDIDSNTLTATLVLSNPAGGILTTGTSGSTTSTYNAATGVWQVSGAKADVNALLASVIFAPVPNFNSNLTIATQVSDGVTSLAGAITLNGTPVNYAPTVEIEPTRIWTRDTGSSEYDTSTDLATDSAGNVYMVGYTRGNLDGNQNSTQHSNNDTFFRPVALRPVAYDDGYITKYDTSGNKLWTKLLGGTNNDIINGITVDSDGNIYVVGDTSQATDALPGRGYAFFAKYDANGNIIWNHQLGTTSFDVLNKITTDGAGNFYAVGSLNNKGLVVKFDSNGNVIWKENNNLGSQQGTDIAFDHNTNSIYVSGSGSAGWGWNSVGGLVLKYGSAGNLIWSNQLTTSYRDLIVGLDVDSNSNVYVSGSTNGSLLGATNLGGYDAFVTKIDSNGNNVWNRQFGSTGNDFGRGIKVDQDGNVIVSGILGENNGAGNYSSFITEFDSNGNRAKWTELISSSDWNSFGQMAFDNNNSLYVAGNAYSSIDGQTNAGSMDAVLLKYNYHLTQTYTEDTPLNLNDLVISDADPEDTITATLQLSNIAAGSLSTLTSGSATATFNATTGTWTVSGNAADVNVILANLYFIPASNFNSNLTINASVTDSHSTPINRTITLIGTAVNDAPTLSSISVLTGATEKLAYTIPYTNLKAASDVQDVDGNAIKFLITAVNSGTLAKNGTAVVPGVTTLSTGESLVWTPANFGNAIPAFNVVATDGTATSATAVPVTVNVAANPLIQKVSIAATDASASESGDTGTVTITRIGSTANALTVNYTTSGTATNGSDYAIDYTTVSQGIRRSYDTLNGSITIPVGSSSVSIPITAIDDTDFEGDEYLNLTLQTSADYVLEGSTSATVSIADNDKPTVSIVASDANAAETLSTETANTGEFTITRTGTTANSLTLNYTVAGTATNGSDYNSLGSTIVIPAGASSVTIPIIPIDNFTLESAETVVLNLSTDNAYNLGTNNSATVNITDNDTSIYESNQTLATAYNLGTISSLQTINDSVSSLDTTDYYKFDVATTGTVTLNIQNFSAGTTLKGELVTKNGPTSSTSLFTVNSSGTVNVSSSAYAGGTNYIRIYQGSGDASYSFEISKTA